jgi:hypothetical protein
MQSILKNQTVFITGASSGIGESCARAFAANGANLIITARRDDRLKSLAKELEASYGIKCSVFKLDVRNINDVETLFRQLDTVPIDIIINNAGLAAGLNKIQDGNISDWDKMIDTNVKGLLYVTRCALPKMIARNKGHIINIGSLAGHFAYPLGNVYCATKFAVRAISQSLRMDLLGTSLRVSEIDPGAVQTEFSKVRFQDEERAKKTYENYQPLQAEDIADAVVYCATRPQHVNISEMVLTPQAQASIRDIYRVEK